MDNDQDTGVSLGEETVTLARTENSSTSSAAVPGKRRNKPTLNCLQCVDRKSKCDRARPACFACIRRQTHCQYTPVADAIAAKSPPSNRPRKRQRTNTSDRSEHIDANHLNIGELLPGSSIPVALPQDDDLELPPDMASETLPDNFDQIWTMTPLLASSIETFAPMVIPSPSASRPRERRALLNLFGAASAEHPFQNYWSDTGGLVEVVASLPSKPEADVLIQRFFHTIDPIHPVVPRDAFIADVERFWSLPDQAKHRHDPAQVALQFAIYANAAQDAILQEGPEARSCTAAFYLSCCHQSLCISSYLNRCSLLTVQTMILICHFMIASNRIADAWSISGIVQRQIYGLKLNRSAQDLGLHIDNDMVQVRLRLWQAAMLQDSLLCLRLRRPPSTIYFDVSHLQLQPSPATSASSDLSDIAYVRSMWQCSALIQETICSPSSSQQPLFVDAAHKSQIVARFRELYARFEEPFCQTAPTRFDNLPSRLLLQMVTVTSHYFHALTLLLIDKNEKTGVHSDSSGAIKAAHEGMTAFFALVRVLPGHICVWTADHSRTYAMAVVIGTMLTLHIKNNGKRRVIADDPQLMLGKSDFDRYINMLGRAQGSTEFRAIQRERLVNLKALQSILRDT